MLGLKSVLILVTAFTLIAMACGGGSNGDDDAESFQVFLEASQEAAESAMLTLEDFPPGWTSSPAEPDDDFSLDLSDECAVLDAETYPGEVSAVESDDFTGPDDQEVSSNATVLTSKEAAASALKTFTRALALESCRGEVVEAFEEELSFDVGADVQVSLEDLSFPTLGDSSDSFRIKVEAVGQSLVFDVTMIQKGNMLGAFFYIPGINSNPDIAEEAEFAELFSAKLEAAEETIPD